MSSRPGFFEDDAAGGEKKSNQQGKQQQQQGPKLGEKKDAGAGKGGEQSSGWFGGIFGKLSLKPKNQMILPDDKNPSVSLDCHLAGREERSSLIILHICRSYGIRIRSGG